MWLKTSDTRIVTQGKLEIYCRDVNLKAFWREYCEKCEEIDWKIWQDCFEETTDEIPDLNGDQVFIKDRVVFVDDDGYGPLCVWVDEVADFSAGLLCYAHVGQHSTASYDYVKKQKPAEDYQDLKKELEGIGYNLEVLDAFPKMKHYYARIEDYVVEVWAENRQLAVENVERGFGQKVVSIWP